MRKTANVKNISSLPLPKSGSSFTLDGRLFKVKEVQTGTAIDGAYHAQCKIETPGCDILMFMTAAKPFNSE